MSKRLDLVISTLSETDSKIEEIKKFFDDGDTVEIHSVVVGYDDNISKEDLVESLQKLWNYEIESNHTIDILIKNLSYEHRKTALGCALQTPQIKNPTFLQNIFCLVKGFNTFEESYFNHEQVFLNDEVEFLDIFDDLEQELKAVKHQVAEYYISMLKTCHLVEAVENNPNAVEMESMYVYLFNSFDVTILAKILTEVKDPEVWATKKIVLNSLGYLAQISEKFVFVNTIMDMIGKDVLEKSIKDSIELEQKTE